MDTAVLAESPPRDTERERETEDGDHSGIRPLPQLACGQCISNKYLIRRVLGMGGFAIVYEAEHLGLGRVMAIKVLHVNEHTPDTLIARFRQEARISALVQHPNVLAVHDTGTLDDGSPYLVMECINGETLHARLTRGPLPISELLSIAEQVLAALCALSEHGIVHRDIKPENLMLLESESEEPIVKLVDFGISKILRPEPGIHPTIGGGLIGTPHYMAPEHLRGEEVGCQADVYAAGVVMYEALTGCLPHDATSLNALALSVLHGDVSAPRMLRTDCPPELERIVLKAMDRDRGARYASPEIMRADIEELARTLRTKDVIVSFTRNDLERGSTEMWVTPTLSMIPEPLRRMGWRSGARVLALTAACVFFTALGPRAERPQSLRAEAGMTALPIAPANLKAEAVHATSSAVAAPSVVATTDTRADAHAGSSSDVHAGGSAMHMRGSDDETANRPDKPRNESRRAHKHPRQKQHAASASSVSIPLPNGPQRQQPEGSDPALLEAALASYVRGRHVEAQGLYLRATHLFPNSPEAFRGLGIVAARLGHVERAREALGRYLVLNPNARDAEAIAARLDALR